ncbi:MAG TPA: hypothetical protein VEA92_00520 [Candidatus Paceibacterota bacterium]|nr:hypothetical protein [Candidatus Paceibacterota bacterium]
MFRVLLSVLFLSALAGAIPAHAQVGAAPITISISPQYPRPYQTIAITPRSTQLNLAASTVTVSVNGTVIEEGTGVLTAYTQVGAAGERSTIRVSVTSNGQTYTAETAVRPADVSLIVEPISTAHPFYKGGSLVASEGRVRLIAIPDIRTANGAVAAENLVYTWRLGNQILESASGIGRSTLTATAPVRYRDANVSVTVSTQDSAVVAQATAAIAPVDPLVRIYRNDPLLGPIFDRAFSGTFAMNGEEDSFRMVPYYFAARPILSWTVNAVASGGDDDITVRATGSGRGSALLSATARHEENFQSADTSLSVRFGEDRALGIFGL